MIECALAVPVENWRSWVTAVADLNTLRALECPGALLDIAAELRKAADREGLEWGHVHDLLPLSVGRHLVEVMPYDACSWRETADSLSAACACLGVCRASLDLGLGRVSAMAFDEGIRRRLSLLDPFIAPDAAWPLSVCVDVRRPPSFPGSREWEVAGNLIHELRGREFGLCVNVHPAELGADFDTDAFLRQCALHTMVLRFCYYPRLGDNISAEVRGLWAEALRRHGFHGLVVFCPLVDDLDALPRMLETADHWAGLLQ
jgi:hypothetical protein